MIVEPNDGASAPNPPYLCNALYVIVFNHLYSASTGAVTVHSLECARPLADK